MDEVGPQSSVNERLVALEIVRQVLTLRFSLYVRDLVVKAINDTEKPVAGVIRDALRKDTNLRSPAQVAELERLIDQLQAMREPAWKSGTDEAERQLTGLADAEPEDQRDLFAFLLPGISLLLPTAASAGALAQPFQGRTVRQWLVDAKADDAKRIRQAVYAGVSAGEGPAAVARRVVGSAAAKGRDGATQLSRNHVDTIIRSASTHFSAYARDQFYRANEAARYLPGLGLPRGAVPALGATSGPVQAEAARQVAQALEAADMLAGGPGRGGVAVFALEQFVAVLDGRTTKLCRGLNGHRYKLGQGPIPPLHMNCRSNRVLVLPDEVGGKVYKPKNYASWFNKQPAAVRKMLSGSTKDKPLSMDELADAAFKDYGARPMSLRQIREESRRLMASY